MVPDSVISPHFIYRKTKINLEIVKSILIKLSSLSKNIEEYYVIECEGHEDIDFRHAFEFTSLLDLKKFIINNDNCPECKVPLNKKNIRVFFKKKAVNPELCR